MTSIIMGEEEQDVVFEEIENAGVITLNRPKVLNAINLSMAEKLLKKLREWMHTKNLVILKGAGDVSFCAGGDIKAVINKEIGPKLFGTEYLIAYLSAKFPIPYISYMNGYAMGGGLGVSVNGKVKIVTEKSMIAMPETKIGLFADIGASNFLSKLEDNLGTYLGLTGHRLSGNDAVKVGLATHFIQSKRWHEVEGQLCRCNNYDEILAVLNRYSEPPGQLSLVPNIKHINYCFGAATVEEIIERLEGVQNDWSVKTLKTLRAMCPASLKMTLRAFQRGAQLRLDQCLQMEYRLACNCIHSHDFSEGVRALLIDKTQRPQWNPRTLSDVTDEYIEGMFRKRPGLEDLMFDSCHLPLDH